MKMIAPNTPTDINLRLLVFGESGVGKTSFAGTFPSPLLIHCTTEGGWKTFATRNGSLFQVAEVGDTHSAWVNGIPGGVRISEDVSTLSRRIQQEAFAGTFPFKTVVVGGFSVIQRLVFAEAEKVYGDRDRYKLLGYVLNWVLRVIQDFFNIPCHVIIEANLKQVYSNDVLTGVTPDITGAGGRHIINSCDFGIFMEQNTGVVTGQLHPTNVTKTKKRFAPLLAKHTGPVRDISYDFFSEELGPNLIPDIRDADPNHPRCRGVWPYAAHIPR